MIVIINGPLSDLGYAFINHPQNTARRFFRKGQPRAHITCTSLQRAALSCAFILRFAMRCAHILNGAINTPR
jgi:hypothetical protein